MTHSPQESHSVLQGQRRGKGYLDQAKLRVQGPGKVQYLDSFCVLLVKGANVKSIGCIHLPTWGDQRRWVLHRARVGYQQG